MFGKETICNEQNHCIIIIIQKMVLVNEHHWRKNTNVGFVARDLTHRTKTKT